MGQQSSINDSHKSKKIKSRNLEGNSRLEIKATAEPELETASYSERESQILSQFERPETASYSEQESQTLSQFERPETASYSEQESQILSEIESQQPSEGQERLAESEGDSSHSESGQGMAEPAWGLKQEIESKQLPGIESQQLPEAQHQPPEGEGSSNSESDSGTETESEYEQGSEPESDDEHGPGDDPGPKGGHWKGSEVESESQEEPYSGQEPENNSGKQGKWQKSGPGGGSRVSEYQGAVDAEGEASGSQLQVQYPMSRGAIVVVVPPVPAGFYERFEVQINARDKENLVGSHDVSSSSPRSNGWLT